MTDYKNLPSSNRQLGEYITEDLMESLCNNQEAIIEGDPTVPAGVGIYANKDGQSAMSAEGSSGIGASGYGVRTDGATFFKAYHPTQDNISTYDVQLDYSGNLSTTEIFSITVDDNDIIKGRLFYLAHFAGFRNLSDPPFTLSYDVDYNDYLSINYIGVVNGDSSSVTHYFQINGELYTIVDSGSIDMRILIDVFSGSPDPRNIGGLNIVVDYTGGDITINIFSDYEESSVGPTYDTTSSITNCGINGYFCRIK